MESYINLLNSIVWIILIVLLAMANKTLFIKIVKFIGWMILGIVVVTSIFLYLIFFPPDIRLSKQPYREGDELIVESSFGQINKMTITKVFNVTGPVAAFTPIPKKTLVVNSYTEVIKESDLLINYCCVLKQNGEYAYLSDKVLHPSKEALPILHFSADSQLEFVNPLGLRIYIFDYISLYNFERKTDNIYGDVYEIPSTRLDGVVVWSEKYGYIKYIDDGIFWELKAFNRDGKNILPK